MWPIKVQWGALDSRDIGVHLSPKEHCCKVMVLYCTNKLVWWCISTAELCEYSLTRAFNVCPRIFGALLKISKHQNCDRLRGCKSPNEPFEPPSNQSI